MEADRTVWVGTWLGSRLRPTSLQVSYCKLGGLDHHLLLAQVPKCDNEATKAL